jgi:hypothetical protein
MMGMVVVALLLLSPSGAMARQDRRWDTPLAGAGGGVRHLRLLEEPPGDAPMLSPREERPSHSLGARLVVEGLAGVGTSLVTGLAGFGLGLAVGRQNGLQAIMSGLVGLGVGFPFGVWWGGELMGGDGSLLVTLGSYLLGSLGLLGLTQVAFRFDARQPQVPLLLGTGVLLPVVGGFLGYELSSSARKKARVRLQPALVLSEERKAIVLAGTF